MADDVVEKSSKSDPADLKARMVEATTSYLRPMKAVDLLRFEDCNIDPWTETYQISFYLEYLAKWPQCCYVMAGRDGSIEAYILGKLESSPYIGPTVEPYDPDKEENPNYLPWHAHITALTVSSRMRKRGHAKRLSEALEREGDLQDAWFIDLFVRTDNFKAIKLYKSMGYSVFRRVVAYYNDDKDAFDMRKPLSRASSRQSIVFIVACYHTSSGSTK